MSTARYILRRQHLTAHERTLVRTLGLRRAGDETLDVALVDTFDGRITRDGGIVLRRGPDGGRWDFHWWSADLAEDRGRVTVDEANPGAATLPRGPVTERLARVLDVRVLLPRAHVSGPVRHWERRDVRGKVVLRLRVDPGLTVRRAGGRRETQLPPQIHVFGLRGFEKSFERARTAIAKLRDVEETNRPWAFDVLREAGHVPGGDPSAVSIDLTRDMTPQAALGAIARAYLDVIRANRSGTCAALDPEFLHDLRVATRRTRTLLKAGKDHWPAPLRDRFREDFRWLARETSRARDLDVYLLDFDELRTRLPRADRPALEPVHEWLDDECEREHARLAAVLDGERVATLLRDWRDLLTSEAFATGHAEAPPTAGDVAADLVDRAHRRILRDGRRIDDDSPDEDLHDLRKRTKELRYLVDAFGGLFDARTARKQIKLLKRLQDNLGVHQDRVVQADTLRHVAHEIHDAPAETLVALGYLIEQLDRDAQRLRDEFAARFAAYDAKDRRRAFDAMLAGARSRLAKRAAS